MKKIFLLTVTALLFIECSSVKKHNEHLNDLISEKKLKSDVDFIHNKLEKLHPNLYLYIAKKDLDYKFDSLKTTITKPMTSFDFYRKLSPVIGSVKQGHMFVYPDTKQLTKKETAALAKKGIGPFSQFEFESFDNKLYVVKNKSYNKTIKPGTEVVAINNKNSMELIKSYNNWFTSDGYNQTFKKSRLEKNFPTFYTYENGIQDSLVYNFKYNDSLKIVSIKRGIVDSVKTDKNQIKKAITKADKEKTKAERKKKNIYGYNDTSKEYNRSLKFMENDSSVAVMKIRGFSIGNYVPFYAESFKKIQKNKSKVLIIDLRDNSGGRLTEIANLYSYLSDSTYVFLDKSEVVSKTSLFNADYFGGGNIGIKALKIVFSPLYYGYTFFKVHKNENGKYLYTSESNPRKISPDAFKGKIYVLINGGSFSASCIISSNLKGSKRAYFVGQETGGAYNGTVAGQMPVIKLPESKVAVRLGLVFIAPHYKTDIEGRGIFPDKEIVPTLQDKINGNDPEMNWILDDIKALNSSNPVSTK